jgi:hypothetical protein
MALNFDGLFGGQPLLSFIGVIANKLLLLGIAYFSPSWTAFQADRGRDFSVIVDGISN